MYLSTLLGLAATVKALSVSGTGYHSCSDVEIPVTVSEKRFILNTTVEDNWDAVSLTFNLTSRVFNTPDDPLPISNQTESPVESNYTIGATLCGNGGTMLILTHGILESKLYFQPNLTDSEQYNFVDAAVAAGYSVLNYDRIGVGSSSRVDPLTDAQFPVQVAVLNALAAHARSALGATRVALVGHSYGAYISARAAAVRPAAADALVLTGFSGSLQHFGLFAAGAGFRVARLRDPARWGGLAPGYLASSDAYAEAYVCFAAPWFERRVARWGYAAASEPFAVGELPTLLATGMGYGDVAAPTLVLQGRYDVSACGGDCLGLLDGLRANFSRAEVLETVDDLPAGHNLFLHTVAPKAFGMVFDFLKKQGL